MQRRAGRPAAVFLSGRDYVAREFEQVQAASQIWRRVLGRENTVTRHFPAADHTFSGPGDCEAVAHATLEWLLAQDLVRA